MKRPRSSLPARFILQRLEHRILMANEIYVDVNATGPHDGTSWEHAYTDLQVALSSSASNVEIRVADGLYTPSTNDRTVSFVLRNDVRLSGGFAGAGAADPDARDFAAYPSILSGDIGIVNDKSDNSYHVVVGSATDSTAVLDGFTITAGRANGPSAGGFRSGPGLFNDAGSPTVSNCVFTANGPSPAVNNINQGSPRFIDCSFTANSGGMANWHASPTLERCVFEGNTSPFGAGMENYYSTLVVTSCTFRDNLADGSSQPLGPAMYNLDCDVLVTDCVFTGNTVYSTSGAVFNSGTSGTFGRCKFLRNQCTGVANSGTAPSFIACTFEGNTGWFGGGMYNMLSARPLVANCAFIGNTAQSGGGIQMRGAGATIVNCTFVSNSAVGAGGAVYAEVGSSATLSDSISWGNTAAAGSEIVLSSSTITVEHSDVSGGYVGAGNINSDPRFYRSPDPGQDGTWGTADDDYGDLRLRENSPCIDAGSNGSVPSGVVTDLAGSARMVDFPGVLDFGEIVDMGAYERPSPGEYLFAAPKPAIRMSFDTDVLPSSVQMSDLKLTLAATSAPVSLAVQSVSYDAASRTATWVLASPIPDGDYRASLPPGSVSDALGVPLTKEIVGNFFALGGDANRDRKVDIQDLSILAMNWQGSGKVFSQGDFNYDGKVDAADLGILSSRWQQTVIPPVAPSPTSLLRAPRRSPTRVVNLLY